MTYDIHMRLACIRYYEFHKKNVNFRIGNIKTIFGIAVSTFYNWLSLYNDNKLSCKKEINRKSIITPEIFSV